MVRLPLSTILIACALLTLAPRISADVDLPAFFGDHMVLQREMPVPVWGTASPGESVTVNFRGQELATTATLGGDWAVTLTTMTAAGPSNLVVTGNNAITLTDVQVGEVWICSGQSNMQWSLNACDNAGFAIASSTAYNISLFRVSPGTAVADAVWQESAPDTVQYFSGVGYFFGMDLYGTQGVPIGLIQNAWGGTAIEQWMTWEGTVGNLYDDRTIPFQPFAIRGAIWYQGESNAGNAITYRDQFPQMIQEWRTDWGQNDDFPFLFVQLARWSPGSNPGWMELREAQMMTLSEPNTAMAVIVDLGDPDPTDIHPSLKQPVGQRLALAARAIAYGEDIVYMGPIYNAAKSQVGLDSITVGFDHIGGGLASQGGDLIGFEIAGADGAFTTATATIVGETVVVSSPSVSEPVTARYGWAPWPECNLFNAEGLPASPFRTGDLQLPLRADAGHGVAYAQKLTPVAFHGSTTQPADTVWSVDRAPAGATVDIAAPTLLETTASFSKSGYYVLRLSAEVTTGTASDTVAVHVQDILVADTLEIQMDNITGKDTLVSGFHDTTTTMWGAVDFLIVYGANDPMQLDNWHSYLEFDLNALDGIASEAVLASATLSLSAFTNGNTDGGTTHLIRRVTEPWVENTVSWVTQPAMAPHDYAATSAPAPVDAWVSWDVTDLVREWHAATHPNYGLAVVHADIPQRVNHWFRASEYLADPSLRPKLRVFHAATYGGLDEVWADFADTSSDQFGTPEEPYWELDEALDMVNVGGTILIKGSTTSDVARIAKPMRIEVHEGPARIGD